MTNFWISALKICGPAAISGLLIYTIYPLILNPEILDDLNSNHRFIILAIISALTFLISYLLLSSSIKKPEPVTAPKTINPTITIKDSTIHGGVAGGNQTNNGHPHE